MSASKFSIYKDTASTTIPSMDNDLLMPDLDQLDTVSDDETSQDSDDSLDFSDHSLYM